jgi:hypothetical protein
MLQSPTMLDIPYAVLVDSAEQPYCYLEVARRADLRTSHPYAKSNPTGRSRPSRAAQTARRPGAPVANRLVSDRHAALEQQLLHIP